MKHVQFGWIDAKTCTLNSSSKLDKNLSRSREWESAQASNNKQTDTTEPNRILFFSLSQLVVSSFHFGFRGYVFGFTVYTLSYTTVSCGVDVSPARFMCWFRPTESIHTEREWTNERIVCLCVSGAASFKTYRHMHNEEASECLIWSTYAWDWHEVAPNVEIQNDQYAISWRMKFERSKMVSLFENINLISPSGIEFT